MSKRYAVIGDSCIDKYIYGVCERICPEGPVPIIKVESFKECLGMAGNTHANAKIFWENQIDFISNNPEEIRKIRYVDSKTNQLLLRCDINDSVARVNSEIKLDFSCIIVSDYCKGFLWDIDVEKLGRAAPLTVLDTKRKLTKKIIEGYNFIKLNEQEFSNNADIVDKETIKKIIITRGSKGVLYNEQEFPPPNVLQTFDVSGAGDVFTTAFTYSIDCGNPITEAIEYAQKCCNQVIRKKGTCVYEKNNMD